jgi:2-methylcitrate dehydratase PrpD
MTTALTAPDYLDHLSGFASSLRFADLPADVRSQVGWILADTVAAIVAGSAEPEVRALLARISPTTAGPTTLPGLGRGAGADVAALLNGTAGTFLEMDEGNRFSRGHPCIHAMPAALALAEERGADAQAFLAAVVVGYEVGSRLGAASQVRGPFHPHGTWGTIGAGAACARILGMDAKAMRETINIAASLTTASSKQTMLQGGLVRNVYAGMSNRNGLLAAQLAESGFSGERDGPGSLLERLISDRFDRDAVVADLGRDFHLMHNYFKLHSCCRYNHGTLDAVDAIAAQGALPPPEAMERIEVTSYHLAAELDDRAPRNTLAAKFSIPFAVATRIVHGHSRLAAFTWDAVRDERVLALAQRVSVTEDPAMTARLPAERPARVVIHGRDGQRWEGAVGVNRGDDASPYTRDELRAKFLDLTGRVWHADHAERTLQATLALVDGHGTLAGWTALLREPPRA